MGDKKVLILGNMAKPGLAEKIAELQPWIAERAEVLCVCPANGPPPAEADGADLAIWQQLYDPLGPPAGSGSPGLDAPVSLIPEPATYVLLTLGGILFSVRRSKRYV